jgi:nicotinate-nucleotide adenylyltransferase
MRVGIFGGTFNPPHVGHLVVAERAREALNLDEVLWIPNRTPPHKAEHDMDPVHRLRMVEIAISGNPAFGVSEIELDRSGKSYTIDTLKRLRDDLEAELILIVGMDSLASFPSWRNPEDIMGIASLATYPRASYAFDSVDPRVRARVTVVDAPVLDISSTDIRLRLSRGESVRYLVPPAVLDYILTNKLYR